MLKSLGLSLLIIFASASVQAQVRSTNAQPLPTANIDSSELRLQVDLLDNSYRVEVADALPNAFTICFISSVPGPWLIDFGAPVGSVQLGVITPVDFFFGISDSAGDLAAVIPFPADLPMQMHNAQMFVQMVSFTATLAAKEPHAYDLLLRLSPVVQSVLKGARYDEREQDGQ